MCMQTGRLLPITADFACGSMVRFFFFLKNLHFVQIFQEKDLVTSALPEANRAGCPDRHLVGNRSRNACQ